MLGTAIGLGAGIIGGVAKLFGRGKANRQMESLLAKQPVYSANPIPGQQYSLAKTLLNARMPGAAQAEANIFKNEANQFGNLNRNSTDSSQALAVGSAIGGGANEAFNDLAVREGADYGRRFNNYQETGRAAVNEDDKVFADQEQNFNNEVHIRGAQNENKQNNWSDISNLGFGIADFGMAGGFNNLFKKKQQQPNSNPYTSGQSIWQSNG